MSDWTLIQTARYPGDLPYWDYMRWWKCERCGRFDHGLTDTEVLLLDSVHVCPPGTDPLGTAHRVWSPEVTPQQAVRAAERQERIEQHERARTLRLGEADMARRRTRVGVR